MASISLLLALLLVFPNSGLTQQQTAATFSSFSISDTPWVSSQTNRTLLSPNSLFSAGFLPTRSNSSLFLFSIWVNPSATKTPVWSLGPVPSSSPIFISPSGSLTLAGISGLNLFNSASTSIPANSSFLRLNNNGSLTFTNWTSFSFPTNTLLPNQLLRKPTALSLSSGKYRFNGSSLFFNSTSFWSTKPISYLTSDGALVIDPTNPRNSLIAADYRKNHTLRRLTLDADGNLRIYSLPISSGDWVVVWEAIQELCEIPNTCGPNSICVPGENFGKTKCVCAPGFRESSVGCVRKKEYLSSSKFLPLDYVIFSEKQGTVNYSPLDFDRCQSRCLANPGCVGFSYILDGWQNCYNHLGELVNGLWSPFLQRTMFLRVASTETDFSNFTGMTSMIETACPAIISLPVPPKVAKNTVRNAAIITTVLFLELLAGALCFLAFLRRYSEYRYLARTFGQEFLPAVRPKQFSYTELRAATADFSNVLGSGGFGVVYSGKLPDGRTVAVKHLRKSSGGDTEFWAEVTIIARMHHLNLIRIWGFCAEKEKRLLVYEYIPNGSLDKFLFSGGTKPVLDLRIRYRIALGVARAIAYLHEECLEWVLHCDIKPENILLDDNFCPKVSDFGLSKLTCRKNRVSMSRIRGTRGYMAPEWVMNEEPITAKADVYSFGVVLLELVAGMRCWDFRRESVESVDWYFPRWAYDKVFVEGKVEEILDERIALARSCDDRVDVEVAERMVKTAMWCVQDRAVARPSMGMVAKMLEGTVEITEPVKPTIFYLEEGRVCAKLLYQSLDFRSKSPDCCPGCGSIAHYLNTVDV